MIRKLIKRALKHATKSEIARYIKSNSTNIDSLRDRRLSQMGFSFLITVAERFNLKGEELLNKIDEIIVSLAKTQKDDNK